MLMSTHFNKTTLYFKKKNNNNNKFMVDETFMYLHTSNN